MQRVSAWLLSRLGDVPLWGRTHLAYPLDSDGHLGCFHILAKANHAAINMCIQGFLRFYLFIYFREKGRDGERERNTDLMACNVPSRNSGLQPSHVP